MENTQVQDVRQAEEYAHYVQRMGWRVEQLAVGSWQLAVFIRKIGPVGIAKIQRVDVEDWGAVNEVLKRNRVVYTKYEPLTNDQWPMTNDQRFRQDSWPMLATRTIRVDLRPSEQDIVKTFKKDCRAILRNIQYSVFNIQVNDFGGFYEMWRKANHIKNLWTPNKQHFDALVESFGKKCFSVTINSLAGCVVLMHQETAYYYYAGSLPEGKKLHLPYLVVWEAMKEAKKRGCKIWDFEGIFDPRWPNKSILGYTHFKKSFGGEEIEFPGSFSKWRWPIFF
jgi:hypothetical protein